MKSIEIINIALDYLFEYIRGPDIENINLIFSLGFFDLISYVITKFDYYKLFLNYVNKENLHLMVDSYAKIECKIIKIFIIYYNISFSPNNSIEEFKKMQQWYDNNFIIIEKKLKKLFYMSEKEMEKRPYRINKMLLSIKEQDYYNRKEFGKRVGLLIINDKNNEHNNNDDDNNIDNNNDNNNQNVYNKNQSKKETIKINDYCIIKFDLLLVYYTLFNYHKDLSSKEKKFKFSHINEKALLLRICLSIFRILYGFFEFIYGIISITIPIIYYIITHFSKKMKKEVELLQDLQDLEKKSETIREERMINFLKKYIRKVEVSINNIIFNVYFPMIDKSNTLLEYRKEYLKVEEIDSSDFVNYLLSKYDYIYIKAKQNSIINNWIFDIPILNILFKNLNVFGFLLIILGLTTTFLIIASFNTFTFDKPGDCGRGLFYFKYAREEDRIQCPRFLYSDKYSSESVIITLYFFIIFQCCFQGLIFLDYTIRTIFIAADIVRYDYISGKIKKNGINAELKISKCDFILHLVFPTLFRYFFNFKTLYFILSLFCLILSVTVHPFFNCVILLEFVNRIEVMQSIVKAMYRPAKNILIILLMFLLLEYFFSFLAQSFFTYHFPNINDTKNFLKTFMRMIDQTFKQDGGIGTYLDKTREFNYEGQEITFNIIDRIVFDAIFYFVVVLLVFQMFLSIIIDYFNATRENSENFHEAMEKECLVCGIDREKIEKINPNDKDAFERHITNSHNVFNYIYYLMYLQSIDDRDVIIDDGVWNLHLVKKLSYLPKNQFFKDLEKKTWKRFNSNKIQEDK